jgi:TRAP-type C4-dicarboxylate transport system substrate-binding protein
VSRAILAAIVCLAILDASGQTATWVLADEYPTTSLPGEGDIFFARGVANRVDGKLMIEPQPDGKTGLKSREQLNAVAEGRVALANTFAGALGDVSPLFLLSSLPFVAANATDARRLYDIARPAYEAALERHNQKLLFSTPWPPSGIWAKVAADTTEAISKLRIRTYDKTGTELFTALGASATMLSFGELPPKLADGEIDAVLSSGDGGAGRALWQFLSQFTEINYALPLSLTSVNLDAWHALDATTQSAVMAAAADTEAHQWQSLEGRIADNYARMRGNGMTIHREIAPALTGKFSAASQSVIAQWRSKSGAEGQAILDRFLEARGSATGSK